MTYVLRQIIKIAPLNILIAIYNFLLLFREFGISERTEKIAIIAPNSTNWVALFVTSLMCKVDIVIISHRKNISDIKSAILTSEPNHIFTTSDIYHKLLGKSDIRMLLSVINIFSMGETYGSEESNFYMKQFFPTVGDGKYILSRLNGYATLPCRKRIDYIHIMDKILKKNVDNKSSVELFTPGVTEYQKRLVYNSDLFVKAIRHFTRIVTNKGSYDITLQNVHYDDWPILTLAQLYNNLRSINKKMFFTTESFNEFWNEYIQSILQTPWRYKLYMKCNWFYRRYITKVFRTEFPNVSEFIILNCQVDYDKLKLIESSKLNFSTTYGMMESEFITLYNNSNDLINTSGELVNDSLKEEFYKADNYPDILFKKENKYIVAGRKINTIKLNGLKISLDAYGKLIKSHPLIKDCIVLVDENEELKATVIINADIAETLGLDSKIAIYTAVNNIILDAYKHVPNACKIKTLFVYDKTTKLIKTHNNLIKVYRYNTHV